MARNRNPAPLPVGCAPSEAEVNLSRPEAATFLRVSIPTLERWASIGTGPKFRKVGKRVLYPLTVLRAFARGDTE